MPASQHQNPKSDIEIAQAAKKRPIMDIAREKLGIAPENLEPYGHYKAKVSMDYIKSLKDKPNGKLILVTAITPTPAGEGKTTTTVGLTDALNHIGKKAMLALREPSLGPSFGMKGGAAGGGYAQVVPMEDINLHFTGDFHAITSAHNLLSALIDNHIYWGNELGIDSRRVAWRRVMDMNDRALREIVCSLGGVANGFPREAGFDITVASEVMAIFCLAKDLDDLKERLGNIIVAYTRDRKPVRARDIKANGAMTVLLKEALSPNLVQTLEGTPAFIHGGPFANIAHGCNSVLATTTALKLADYVVTEAGFGADLGGEKFLDIKCRKTGLQPDCAVIVATIRALKMHGGVKKDDLKKEDLKALETGMANLQRHVENIQKFGIPAVVSINRFSADTDAEIALVKEKCKALGVEALMADHWAMGGEGAADVARAVVKTIDAGKAKLKLLYPDDMPLFEKIRTIAKEIYRAKDATADKAVRDQLANFEAMGYGKAPVCIAKTQYSFSTNGDLKGAPSDHTINVREVRLSAGAEFVVAICGEIMTMPGLPRVPAARLDRRRSGRQDRGAIDRCLSSVEIDLAVDLGVQRDAPGRERPIEGHQQRQADRGRGRENDKRGCLGARPADVNEPRCHDDQRGQDQDDGPLDRRDLGVADPDAIDARVVGPCDGFERTLLRELVLRVRRHIRQDRRHRTCQADGLGAQAALKPSHRRPIHGLDELDMFLEIGAELGADIRRKRIGEQRGFADRADLAPHVFLRMADVLPDPRGEECEHQAQDDCERSERHRGDRLELFGDAAPRQVRRHAKDDRRKRIGQQQGNDGDTGRRLLFNPINDGLHSGHPRSGFPPYNLPSALTKSYPGGSR